MRQNNHTTTSILLLLYTLTQESFRVPVIHQNRACNRNIKRLQYAQTAVQRADGTLARPTQEARCPRSLTDKLHAQGGRTCVAARHPSRKQRGAPRTALTGKVVPVVEERERHARPRAHRVRRLLQHGGLEVFAPAVPSSAAARIEALPYDEEARGAQLVRGAPQRAQVVLGLRAHHTAHEVPLLLGGSGSAHTPALPGLRSGSRLVLSELAAASKQLDVDAMYAVAHAGEGEDGLLEKRRPPFK
eukprot:CAMPEP_0183346414 /NCGR_PEP_ID=MMETSP0164_2-20130417/11545_1 /TAXON_ID=221442 /ORGANISM="Coccolithus pelagicus ssp braarudi, Strain PLY182g" /LENGTH=244 /DNA_ID=CAMNT_0025517689 /DNA_START=104 /DNA_END=836 /DNA_ORIENTATION=+